jgi:hypothetical protein
MDITASAEQLPPSVFAANDVNAPFIECRSLASPNRTARMSLEAHDANVCSVKDNN